MTHADGVIPDLPPCPLQKALRRLDRPQRPPARRDKLVEFRQEVASPSILQSALTGFDRGALTVA